MFEMTLGAKLSSAVTNPNLLQQDMVTSFILAFSGLSVQAQVASILAETDIRFAPFFFARIIHGFIAAILAYILWNPLYIEFSHFGKVTMDYPVSQMMEAHTYFVIRNLITNRSSVYNHTLSSLYLHFNKKRKICI